MIMLDTIWTKGSSFHLTKTICQKLEAKTKTTSGSGYHVLFGPAKQFLRKLKFLRFQIRLTILLLTCMILKSKKIVISAISMSFYIINDIVFGIQELFNHMQLPCRK